MKYAVCVWFLIMSTTITFGQDPVKIMCLGNSITQGEGSSVASDGITHNTWRRKLWQHLSDTLGYHIDFIGSLNQAYPCENYPDPDFDWDHEGHWAWTIDEILYGRNGNCNGTGRLGQWLNAKGSPDYVLVHLGTNDCWGGQSVTSSVIELEALIDTLQTLQPNMTILLAQIIGHLESTVDACIQQLNDSIPKIAARKATDQSKIVVVDQYTGFNPALDLYDAAHPNDNGEDLIFQNWFTALDPLLAGTTLAVDLSFFQARRFENSIKLSWTTASETGTNQFILERKKDMAEFEEIHREIARGTPYETTQYQYVDHIINRANGHFQYRLKMVDGDGSIDWSSIQSVYLVDNDSPEIWPNVLTNAESIWIKNGANSRFQILDSQGIQYYSGHLKVSQERIILPQLPAGIYFMQIASSQRVSTLPFLIM